MPSSVMRAMVSPLSRFRDRQRGRQFAGDVENEDAIGVHTHIDIGAGLPFVDACRKANPGSEADVDVNETFRSADLGHRDLTGKAEARGLRLSDRNSVGAKSQAII